ncbi:MAG: serine protease [Dehalococcoidales bacterium]|nr:serine protease [Dehalococcoidales bacterium]
MNIEMSGPIIVMIVFAVACVGFVIFAIIQGQRRKLTAGIEDMVGRIAVAQTSLNPKGMVRAEGEIWAAVSEGGDIEPGEEVVITQVKGLKLRVAKKSKEKEKEGK